jgi:hypothetical protein
MTWKLIVVENAGEIPADKAKDEVAVSTKPLLTDIKAQLMIAQPKTLVYTVGWRALVWQNEETNQFKDITEEEYDEYLRTGTINTAGENTTVASTSGGTDGNAGSNNDGTASDTGTA